MGKSTINGPFSIAMLVYQRVYPDKIPWTHLVRRISGNTSIFIRDFAIFHDPILSDIPMEYHQFWVQSILLLVKQVKRPFQVIIDPKNPRSPIVSHDIPTKSPLNHHESPGLLVQPPIFDAPDGLKCRPALWWVHLPTRPVQRSRGLLGLPLARDFGRKRLGERRKHTVIRIKITIVLCTMEKC